MGELTKTNNFGKQSPGPIYNFRDDVKYNKVNKKVSEKLLGLNLGFWNCRENGCR